jgi:uncharacterized protein YceK
MIVLRRIFMCWWGGCGGVIRLDAQGEGPYWRCATCGRITPR